MRKRTQARELALQLLYQADQRGDDPAEESAEYLSEKTSDPEIRDFALALLRGCLEQRTELDRHIREVAANWDVSRMAVVDRNVLRLAIYELTVRRDTPPPVIINEAIEMAKRFGAKQSGGFVNGILDKVRERAERAGREGGGAGATPAAGGGGETAPRAPEAGAEADAPALRTETEEE